MEDKFTLINAAKTFVASKLSSFLISPLLSILSLIYEGNVENLWVGFTPKNGTRMKHDILEYIGKIPPFSCLLKQRKIKKPSQRHKK